MVGKNLNTSSWVLVNFFGIFTILFFFNSLQPHVNLNNNKDLV